MYSNIAIISLVLMVLPVFWSSFWDAHAEEPEEKAETTSTPANLTEDTKRFLPYVQPGFQYGVGDILASNAITHHLDAQESKFSIHPTLSAGLDQIYYRNRIIFIPALSLRIHLGSGQKSDLGLIGLPPQELPAAQQGPRKGFLVEGELDLAGRIGLTSLKSGETGIGVYFMGGPYAQGRLSKLFTRSAQGEIGLSQEAGLISAVNIKAFMSRKKLIALIGAVADGSINDARSDDAFSKDYKDTKFLAVRVGGHVLVFISDDFIFDLRGAHTLAGHEFAGKKTGVESFMKAHLAGPVHPGFSFRFQDLKIDAEALKYAGPQGIDPHPDLKPTNFIDVNAGLTLDIDLDFLIHGKSKQ